MFNTDIILINSCGCEIARLTVGNNEDPSKAIVRAITDEHWALDEGDTVKIESTWHEEEN